MGRFLMDTHVFLWLIQGDPLLSDYLSARLLQGKRSATANET